MSVAGLRHTGAASSQQGTPLETRSVSYIYDGQPQYYHDWEFRPV